MFCASLANPSLLLSRKAFRALHARLTSNGNEQRTERRYRRWRLLRRVSKHGFDFFDAKSIGHGPTITVVKLEDAEGTIVGGFTSKVWKWTDVEDEAVRDPSAFIFKISGDAGVLSPDLEFSVMHPFTRKQAADFSHVWVDGDNWPWLSLDIGLRRADIKADDALGYDGDALVTVDNAEMFVIGEY